MLNLLYILRNLKVQSFLAFVVTILRVFLWKGYRSNNYSIAHMQNCLLYASFLHASLSPGKKQQQFSHLFTFNSTLQSHVGNSENVMPSKTVNASSYRRKSYGKITYGFFCNFSPHHCSVILNILTSNSVAYLQVFYSSCPISSSNRRQ